MNELEPVAILNYPLNTLATHFKNHDLKWGAVEEYVAIAALTVGASLFRGPILVPRYIQYLYYLLWGAVNSAWASRVASLVPALCALMRSPKVPTQRKVVPFRGNARLLMHKIRNHGTI